MKFLDQRTIDSTGSFLVQQLEQLDPTMHLPLQEFSWSRDINVRSDVTMAHDFSSFTQSAMASVGGISPNRKAFISKYSSTLPSVALDIGKTASPLLPWGLEASWSVFELESSQLLGQPIDEQKFNAVRVKLQQDTDIQVYLGDTDIPNAYGLLNSPQVTNNAAVAASGVGSSTLWTNKTPAQILTDINELLNSVYTASGFAKCPTKLGLSPVMFGYLVTTLVSSAGNVSILTYVKNNCLAMELNGRPLEIVPIKWATGTNNNNTLGVNATDMMVAYTQEYDVVRFPMVPMMRLPIQFKGASQIAPYVCKLGLVEFVRPEAIGTRYGIN